MAWMKKLERLLNEEVVDEGSTSAQLHMQTAQSQVAAFFDTYSDFGDGLWKLHEDGLQAAGAYECFQKRSYRIEWTTGAKGTTLYETSQHLLQFMLYRGGIEKQTGAPRNPNQRQLQGYLDRHYGRVYEGDA